MTIEEALTKLEKNETLKVIRERIEKQEWAKDLDKIPQIDRQKIIQEINERMSRYAGQNVKVVFPRDRKGSK